MANPNLLDFKVRRDVLQGIKSEDNRSRKREHQKRFDVYRERQDGYILERLEREFDPDTVDEMRKVFSINLSTRIIDEMSSIFNAPPEREYATDTSRDLSEPEEMQLHNLYEMTGANVELRRANKFYNLHDQCAIMVVPDLAGNIKVRAVPPFHYDVIPDAEDAEKAYAVILNVWNFDLHKTARNSNTEPTQLRRYRQQNQMNEAVADDDDRKAMEERYVVWTADLHFEMDGTGEIIKEPIQNPIGRLPFIDVATDKDFQYFVRRGTSVVDFALDWSLVFSDLANTLRLQNYSQAIVYSEKQPKDMKVGPARILWMKVDANRPEVTPRFEFASPSPDISGSLEFLETMLRVFLSSRGVDPSTISGKGEARSFSSGVERLLSMLDKFEATRADFDLFTQVEVELFDLLVSWSNVFQDVSGPGELIDDLRKAKIGDDVFLDVKFSEPQSIQTKGEKEESTLRLLDAGLMSRKEAIMELRGVSEESADKILDDIDEAQEEETPELPPEQFQPVDPEGEEEQEEDDGGDQ